MAKRKAMDADTKKFRQWIRKCETGLPKELKDYVAQTAEDTRQLAEELCPKDTGELSRSIYWELQNGGTVAKISTNMPYARYVEQGTMYQMPQPYMSPAYYAMSETFGYRCRQIIQNFLKNPHI